MSALRKLFGPGKEKIWRQFCVKTGANYIAGGIWKQDKAQITHGEWTVAMIRRAWPASSFSSL